MQMAQTAMRPAVVDFVELATSSDNLELAMEEITIAASSALADQSILDANLRQRFGVIVVGIQRAGRRMEFNPEPDTAIRAGDKLVVLGRPAFAEAARGGGGAVVMPARVLDGDRRGAADSRRGRAGGRRVHGARRPAARPRHRAGRRRSGLGDLRRAAS